VAAPSVAAGASLLIVSPTSGSLFGPGPGDLSKFYKLNHP
jgi:hypothetical protein